MAAENAVQGLLERIVQTLSAIFQTTSEISVLHMMRAKIFQTLSKKFGPEARQDKTFSFDSNHLTQIDRAKTSSETCS